MILELLANVLATILGGIFDLFISLIPTPPAGLVSAIQGATGLIDDLHVIDSWIPVDLALTLVGLVLAAYVGSIFIGIARLIVSYFTLGSGAT